MDCKECKKVLGEYCAGDLDEAERAAVRAHLEVCGPCAKEEGLFSSAIQALRAAGEEVPATDRAFHRALKRRLDDVDYRLGRRSMPVVRWHFIGGVAATAAAVMIIASVLATRLPVTPEEQPGQQQAVGELYGIPTVFLAGPIDVRAVSFEGQDRVHPYYVPSSPFVINGSANGWNNRAGAFVTLDAYQALQARVDELSERIRVLEASGQGGAAE